MNARAPLEELVTDCLAVRVRLFSRAMTALYDKAVSEYGVTIAQVNLLAALGAFGASAPATLAKRLHRERSTVCRTLDLLIVRGLGKVEARIGKGLRAVRQNSLGLRKIADVIPNSRQAQRDATSLVGSAGAAAIGEAAAVVGGFDDVSNTVRNRS